MLLTAAALFIMYLFPSESPFLKSLQMGSPQRINIPALEASVLYENSDTPDADLTGNQEMSFPAVEKRTKTPVWHSRKLKTATSILQ